MSKEEAKILVVDDDQDILNLCEALLTAKGYSVSTAHDALEAMDILNSTQFDAILTDANMPVYSGFDFIKTIRHQSRFRSVATAMLTGRREKKDIEKALRLGVDDYIIKPIDPLILAQKVEDLLLKKSSEKKESKKIEYTPLSSGEKGQINFEIQILALSELGIKAETSAPLNEGSIHRISSSLFEQLGTKTLPLRVSHCDESEANHWIVEFSFIGSSDSLRQKIRAWNYQQLVKSKQVA